METTITERNCEECYGTGSVASSAGSAECPKCSGSGRIKTIVHKRNGQ